MRERWQAWERTAYPAEQYPPGSAGGTVAGVDLALLDGDIAAFFVNHVERGGLSESERQLVPQYIRELDRALEKLERPGRDYFLGARELLAGLSARG